MEAARDRLVPDVVAEGLQIVFCGINPGLYTAAVGHHFARPGNRFWPGLHLAGFTPRLFAPHEERQLLPLGYGITNLVPRATAAAAELSPAELEAGGAQLQAKMRHLQPAWLAVLGVDAYRRAFGARKAAVGPQPERLGTTRLWLLPNPSGLNAHYTLPAFAAALAELRAAAGTG